MLIQKVPTILRLLLACCYVLIFNMMGCSPERDPESKLVVAARAKDLAEVRKLLDAGVSANAREIVEGEGRSAVYHAAGVGATDVVKLLIAKGANVNEAIGGRPTPLMAAAVNGHVDVVVALLDAGANIDAREMQTGATALTDAARNGHLEVVRILVKHGADVTATLKDGNTALSWAKSRGFPQIADILMDASNRVGPTQRIDSGK